MTAALAIITGWIIGLAIGYLCLAWAQRRRWINLYEDMNTPEARARDRAEREAFSNAMHVLHEAERELFKQQAKSDKELAR